MSWNDVWAMFLYQEKMTFLYTHFEPIKIQFFFLITLNKGHLSIEVNIMFAYISFDL